MNKYSLLTLAVVAFSFNTAVADGWGSELEGGAAFNSHLDSDSYFAQGLVTYTKGKVTAGAGVVHVNNLQPGIYDVNELGAQPQQGDKGSTYLEFTNLGRVSNQNNWTAMLRYEHKFNPKISGHVGVNYIDNAQAWTRNIGISTPLSSDIDLLAGFTRTTAEDEHFDNTGAVQISVRAKF